MKIAITGSRKFIEEDMIREDINIVKNLLSEYNINMFEHTLLSCHDEGVDAIVENIWKENNGEIKLFIPDWELYSPMGDIAHLIANVDVSKEADILIVIWNGVSKTVNSMAKLCDKLGMPVYKMIHIRKEEDPSQNKDIIETYNYAKLLTLGAKVA